MNIFICIADAIIVGLFVFLAIHFGHWWIVLFAALFMLYSDNSNDQSGGTRKGEDNEK